VVLNWVSLFIRPCTPFGCLPSEEYVSVTAGTGLVGLELQNGWWRVQSATSSSQDLYVLASAVKVVNEESWSLEEAKLGAVETAQQMLGWYYFWGGRSAFNADLWNSRTQTTGVDCSGLVTLSFRTNGLNLPRNAHDIFLVTQNITASNSTTTSASGASLVPGDLIFFADAGNLSYMTHVMLVVESDNGEEDEGGWIAESNWDISTGPNVPDNNGTRIISAVEKYGLPLSQLDWGQPIQPGFGSYFIFFGTLTPSSLSLLNNNNK
jgi:hypothetical protein